MTSINEIIAIIPIFKHEHKQALSELSGLPLFLRACYNLNKVISKDRIYVVTKDPAIITKVQEHGFQSIEEEYNEEELETKILSSFYSSKGIRKIVVYPVFRPFISENSILEIIIKVRENNVNFFYLDKTRLSKPIENLTTYSDEEMFLCQAVDNGLPVTNEYKTQFLISGYLKKIFSHCQWVICDVDGVLTDGKMIYSEDGNETKAFNVRDGIAANLLKQKGINLGILSSGRNKNLVSRRAGHLLFDYISVEDSPKLERFYQFLKEKCLRPEQVAYIGDDINDLEVMEKCRISFCPSDAHISVIKKVDWALKSRGGEGCLRELADFLVDL